MNSRLSVIGFVLGAGHNGTLCLSKLQDTGTIYFCSGGGVPWSDHIGWSTPQLRQGHLYLQAVHKLLTVMWLSLETKLLVRKPITNDIGFNSYISRFVYKEKTYRRELDQYY